MYQASERNADLMDLALSSAEAAHASIRNLSLAIDLLVREDHERGDGGAQLFLNQVGMSVRPGDEGRAATLQLVKDLIETARSRQLKARVRAAAAREAAAS